ncbi:MAG: hypothetical protein KAS32_14730 [Candidatus Peribacteraceae bacterium]|nr:hypothetical protein [Candidatus Peribacteraceae bacterium]
MKDNYPRQRSWSDKYIQQSFDILEDVLGSKVTESTYEQDILEGFDAITEDGRTIALRFRRPTMAQFADELTIRASVRSNGKTELDKIKSGTRADIYFGGLIGTDDKFAQWWAVDGDKLQSTILWDKPTPIDNVDDGTSFIAIDLEKNPEIVIRSYRQLGEMKIEVDSLIKQSMGSRYKQLMGK